MSGQTGLHVKAPGEGGGFDQRKAEHPDQRRMLHQVLTKIGDVRDVLGDLDQVSGDKGSVGHRRAVRAEALVWAVRKTPPVQWPQQAQVLEGHVRFAHEARQMTLVQLRQLR